MRKNQPRASFPYGAPRKRSCLDALPQLYRQEADLPNPIARTKAKEKKPTKASLRLLTPTQEEAKMRGLAAINRVRKGKSKSLSAAAKAEGTTVKAIRELLPGSLRKGVGRRTRVKAGDSYSQRVTIITAEGPLVVMAHGSRERDLNVLAHGYGFDVLCCV